MIITETDLPGTAALGNGLLARLPADERGLLLPALEPVALPVRGTLHEPGRPIDHVHFPTAGVISVLATLRDGGVIEVGMIGSEGMVGLPVFLGAEAARMTTVAQVEGAAVRMRADAFRAAVRRGGPLVGLMHRYVHAFLGQLSHSVACNRLHVLAERLARWMLMIRDRAGDEFPITHEHIGQMLGVHRPMVTGALQELQRAGAIEYARGRIRIVDRGILEGASCECYRAVRAEYDELIGRE